MSCNQPCNHPCFQPCYGGFQSSGMIGLPGPTGPIGPIGPTGPISTVSIGPTGATGVGGLTGATGTAGATGASFASQYAYIYNLTAQSVAINAPVLYDTNGLITAGITHTPGSSTITVTTAGIYMVTFIEAGTEPNQFALRQNGVVVAGTVYPSGAGTQSNPGQVIVSAAAGDVFSVYNNLSAAAVTLTTPIGGTAANVNASIMFLRLA